MALCEKWKEFLQIVLWANVCTKCRHNPFNNCVHPKNGVIDVYTEHIVSEQPTLIILYFCIRLD